MAKCILQNILLNRYKIWHLTFKTSQHAAIEGRRVKLRPKQSSFRGQNFEYFQTNLDFNSTIVQMHDRDHVSLKVLESMFPNVKQVVPDVILNYLSFEKNFQELTTVQLKSMMEILAKSGLNFSKHGLPLKFLDEKISSNINDWSINLTLYMFDAWFWIRGDNILSTKYCAISFKHWSTNINKLSKNNILQIMYYLGVLKPANHNYLLDMMKQKLEKEFINEVTDSEWAIVCLSYFRSSTRLGSIVILLKIIEVTHRFIEKDDRYNLINALKCLRLAQRYDKKLFQALEIYVTKEFGSFNFVECTNFLATFSSQNVYNREVFNLLEKQGRKMLLNEQQILFPKSPLNLKEHPSVRSRTKDISRFLWALVHVGHEFEQETIDYILAIIDRKFEWGEYKNHLQILVDSLQSLAIKNIYPSGLLQKIFTPDFFQLIWRLKEVKPRYQLYFLYKSMEKECPEIYLRLPKTLPFIQNMTPLQRDFKKQIEESQGIEKALVLLKQHCGTEFNVKLSCVLPHIALIGITIELSGACISFENFVMGVNTLGTKKNWSRVICLEILDANVCCRDSTDLLGLMKAKLRQLERCPYKLITWTIDDIESIWNAETEDQRVKIMSYLRD